jgi:hypothetical protein
MGYRPKGSCALREPLGASTTRGSIFQENCGGLSRLNHVDQWADGTVQCGHRNRKSGESLPLAVTSLLALNQDNPRGGLHQPADNTRLCDSGSDRNAIILHLPETKQSYVIHFKVRSECNSCF